MVFIDIGMPGMNGHETTKRMRADEPSGSLTLVALTGWGAEADRIKTQAAGFDHHFSKPLKLENLDSVLQQVALRQSSALRAHFKRTVCRRNASMSLLQPASWIECAQASLHGAGVFGQRRSMEIPTSDAEFPQQRRQIFEMPGDQIPHLPFPLPPPPHRHQP